jgi:hypothetical protein
MKKYQKTALLEVVENRGETLLVQNAGDPSDQWEIPAKTFHGTYVEARQDIGWAKRMLKAGKRVRRAGWNGKGMYLYLVEGRELYRSNLHNEAYEHAPMVDKVKLNAHIDMVAADGSIVIGWLASQTDLLAEDYELVED